MGSQEKRDTYTQIEINILDLEKKYFEVISSIMTSKEFLFDLSKIEEYIKFNYKFLNEFWDLKNKIKIPAERLLRHHFNNSNIVSGFYPSPISCDIAIETEDCILNMDVKTIDIIGNAGDIYTIQFEHNQCSFRHEKVLANGTFPGFSIHANLPSLDPFSKKPILTYLIKIIYSDTGQDFELLNPTDYPLMSLTCLPNGEISSLFNNNIFSNFKTYNYHKASEDEYYTPKRISSKSEYDSKPNRTQKYDFIQTKCSIPSIWERVTIVGKNGYYDKDKEALWVTVQKGTAAKTYELQAVSSPQTCRFNQSLLETRYDSKGVKWKGIQQYSLKK